MTDFVGVYKFITELPFEFCADAQIGDIAIGTAHVDKIPDGWLSISNSYVATSGLADFDRENPTPSLLVFKTPKHSTDVIYERVSLKENQVWYPRVNCGTYKEKKIISINKKENEIFYREPGMSVSGQIESFVEWIIITGASLTKK